jgi:hypothetical protein
MDSTSPTTGHRAQLRLTATLDLEGDGFTREAPRSVHRREFHEGELLARHQVVELALRQAQEMADVCDEADLRDDLELQRAIRHVEATLTRLRLEALVLIDALRRHG